MAGLSSLYTAHGTPVPKWMQSRAFAQVRHAVHCPTVAGNNPGDDRDKIGLDRRSRQLSATSKRQFAGHPAGRALLRGMLISGSQTG